MAVVEQRLELLNGKMPAFLQTLEGESMLVETNFPEQLDGADFLYWFSIQFSIQAQGGINVQESEHWVDKKHLQYWRECVDHVYPGVDFKPRVVMIPEAIRNQ